MTLTETVQVPPVPTVPPTSLMPVSPAASVPPPPSCKVPPQVLVVASGVATTRFGEGKLSVKPTPVRATVFAAGFVIVKVSVVVVLSGAVEGENALAMDGGATTVCESVAELPLKLASPA